jgi:hypothetical protein
MGFVTPIPPEIATLFGIRALLNGKYPGLVASRAFEGA